jgi:pimeloyl-ACP methyl ester carboxylesterase
MDMVTSADGTKIAYQKAGSGPPLIFVVGAFNDHHRCADLAGALSDQFTVVTYDRRARGESGDTRPYAVDREVDDLVAVIEVTGGPAAVFGYSSGALLALHAAASGAPIDQLVLFEPSPAPPAGSDMAARLQALIDAGRPGDAVALFQTEAIGMPAEVVAGIRQSPMFAGLEAIAQSVVYDVMITDQLGRPTPSMMAVKIPTLVLSGADTWPQLVVSAAAIADAVEVATHEVVPGGTQHDIPTDTTARIVRTALS